VVGVNTRPFGSSHTAMHDARLTGLWIALGSLLMVSFIVVVPASPRPGPRLASLDATPALTAPPPECLFVRVSSILAGPLGRPDPRLVDLSALRNEELTGLGPMHLLELEDGVACAGATHHSRLVTGQKLAVHVERAWGARHRVVVTVGREELAIEVGTGEPILLLGRSFAGADLVVVVRLGHASSDRP
jgi:hypothetical protein